MDSCKGCARRKTIDRLKRAGLYDEHIKEAVNNQKATLLEKHGVDHPSRLPGHKEKCRSKADARTPEQKKDIKDKAIKTLTEKHGEKYWEYTANKRRLTNLARYGVEDSSKLDFAVAKRRKTTIERYGVDNFARLPECRERINEVWQEKYGVKEIFNSEPIKQKIKDSNMEKYGREYPIRKFGKAEKEIQDWLLSLGFDFQPDTSILGGREIDLFCPAVNLGIEYCGLYWHCENPEIGGGKSRNYHHDKYLDCEKAGIRLITIFEDEWLNRRDQVKSFLKATLGVAKTRLFARKCTVLEVSKPEAASFIAKYHIQGSNFISKYHAGLFADDELVGVMTFANHHRQNDLLVLDRLCFKDDVYVIGGASKLFKFLTEKTKVQKITSWSDNRWSIGNVYSSLGFSMEEDAGPDYSYFMRKERPLRRVSKQSQKKSNTGCPDEMTEKEWCAARGLYRIWDCGKKRWVWNEPQLVETQNS
jgi:hypothetical protein